MDEADARQRRQGARRERNTDCGRQRRGAGSNPEEDRRHGGRPRARSRERRAARTQPVPRHHRLPGDRLGGRRVRRVRPLLDIRDVANPKRMDAVSDSNFSYWHSATFNNDGTKLLFSDEWGGGGQPKCRATDKREWGADAIFTLADNRMTFQSYYKMSAPQTQFENCVAHNGS